MERVAAADACMDHMSEQELRAFVVDTSKFVEELSAYVDAAKEMKRSKTGWLQAQVAKD